MFCPSFEFTDFCSYVACFPTFVGTVGFLLLTLNPQKFSRKLASFTSISNKNKGQK